MTIRAHAVSKRFGAFVALDRIDLEVQRGSLLALLGPSGSGKTTLLRIIAGLETADEGRIVDGQDDITEREARDRGVGFVFQHYALFRHMTIEENVGYALRVRGVPRAQRRARVDELLALIRLEGHRARYPAQLSGGQRQRVALARALAARPRVLLLDEPFGALDAKVRQELRSWLRRLHDEIELTTIFVTHDQEEAFEVADRVVVMNQGRIEQVGTPTEVFERPASAFVIDFLGRVNVLRGGGGGGGDAGDVYVRPHELEIWKQGERRDGLKSTILRVNPAGPIAKVELRVVGEERVLNAEVAADRFAELDVKTGDLVFVAPRRTHVFLPVAPGSTAK